MATLFSENSKFWNTISSTQKILVEEKWQNCNCFLPSVKEILIITNHKCISSIVLFGLKAQSLWKSDHQVVVCNPNDVCTNIFKSFKNCHSNHYRPIFATDCEILSFSPQSSFGKFRKLFFLFPVFHRISALYVCLCLFSN